METTILHKGDKWFLTTTEGLHVTDLLLHEIQAQYGTTFPIQTSLTVLYKSDLVLHWSSSSFDKLEPISSQTAHCDLTLLLFFVRKENQPGICWPLKEKMAPTFYMSTCPGISLCLLAVVIK